MSIPIGSRVGFYEITALLGKGGMGAGQPVIRLLCGRSIEAKACGRFDTRPVWSRDQRELFYVGPDNSLMTIPISMNGTTIQFGNPTALFPLPPASVFDVSRDGKRFLITKVVKEASPITLLLNWKPPAK